MNNTALVTLAVGDSYVAQWRELFAPGWCQYAQRHSIDIVVIDVPPDPSDRRNVSWQKCLAPGGYHAGKYGRIALIDADIAINPLSPNIFDQLPAEYIGGVISGSHIHADLQGVLIGRKLNTALPYELQQPAIAQHVRSAYEDEGLTPHDEGIVQAGVLVLSPRLHADILARAYTHTRPEARSYEQIPLSHQILSSRLFRPIDTRFNSVFLETLHVHHPYAAGECGRDLMQAIVKSEFENNFFLHFAYNQTHLARLLLDH
jgi:hypothetical protein